MKQSQEYYTQLGVPADATREEIQKAYRRLARKYHPDINQEAGAEERFKLINEAHSVLSDPDKRKLYDRYGSSWQEAGGREDQYGYREYGNDESQEFGHAFRFKGEDPFAGSDYDDIFSNIFGGSAKEQDIWREVRDAPGRSVEAELEVSLEELVHGAVKTISWNSLERVGRAVRPVEQKVQLKIPKGLTDGSQIRLAGKGEKSSTGGASGDLLLRIRVRPDPRFSLHGYDLITTVPVAPWEAALGTKIVVDTIDGGIHLAVPRGCGPGRKLRVRGKGLPLKDGGAGDLIVVIEVHVPKNLTEEERRLFEELESKSAFNPRSHVGQRAADYRQAA